ncbi:histidine phosphatase family protein [Brevundimonas sp. AJA228-03]|uniref:SixA phosphatase family protein n=1 Tax=Brevundimonas sp. AJA228-03 TaxID=2752515 RepID=UPI001ADF0354|nr:histidine phosphatase family protein [Brevundimonas sp. AJA228-03]QTN19481.1 histidine phosphatase family protein [Brevundimonas sp. AJA228-03]
MHHLILMRHAKTERAAVSGLDRDRALTPRGLDDAILMGRILVEKGLRPDLALVSPAVRTRQTWDAVHEALGDVEVRIEPRLYDASTHTIRRLVEDAEEQAGCLLVMAHNPGIHTLALEYLTESAASPSILDRMAGGFPTGAAAVFEVDVAGRCAYDGFLTPKAFGGGADE